MKIAFRSKGVKGALTRHLQQWTGSRKHGAGAMRNRKSGEKGARSRWPAVQIAGSRVIIRPSARRLTAILTSCVNAANSGAAGRVRRLPPKDGRLQGRQRQRPSPDSEQRGGGRDRPDRNRACAVASADWSLLGYASIPPTPEGRKTRGHAPHASLNHGSRPHLSAAAQGPRTSSTMPSLATTVCGRKMVLDQPTMNHARHRPSLCPGHRRWASLCALSNVDSGYRCL